MRVYTYVVMALSALMLTACGGGEKPRQEVAEPDSLIWDMDMEEIVNVSGLVVKATDDELDMVTEAGDTLHYSYKLALEENRVFGRVTEGEKLTVMPSDAEGVAETVVNLTTLMGDWYIKNAAGEWMGFTLQDGGVASSINMETQTYKRWEMGGGRLLLTSVSDGSGSTMELTDTCDINYLTPDSLQLIFHFSEGEHLFRYTRKRGE